MKNARRALGLVCMGIVFGIASVASAQATATTSAASDPAPASASATPADGHADATVTTTATVTTSAAPDATPASTPVATPAVAAATAPPSATPAAPPAEDDEHCTQPPAFDPGSPRLDISVGGGYAAYFVTWRQAVDSFMAPGAHVDGLYQGPLVRGEVELGLGSFSLSVNYTHIFSQHDGTAASVDWALLSGEIGLQCACSGASYVWGFGLEVGWDLNNNTVFAGIEHRSQWFVWEGLFLGFDFDVAVLAGLTSHGASGGAFEGSLFLGYSIG